VDADDTDIGTQLLRVMREHPGISRDRVLSEIGILFVEGFETTGVLGVCWVCAERVLGPASAAACMVKLCCL
jgi:hypothetical protein